MIKEMKNPQNTKGKIKLNNISLEEKKKRFEEYLQYKSSYYKGQLCTFYLRGGCWKDKDKCQFAHGIKDLNVENFLQFSDDKLNNKLKNYTDIAENVQRYYFIYFFPNEESSEDNKNRSLIKRKLWEEIFEEFLDIFLLKICKNKEVSIENFEKYYECLGFKNKISKFFSNKVLNKQYIDKETNQKKTFLAIISDANLILKDFIHILINILKENVNINNFSNYFPLSFKKVSSIINNNIPYNKPYVSHYCKYKGIYPSDFLEELFNELEFRKGIEELFSNLKLDVEIKKEKIIYIQDITEALIEIKDNIWDKYNDKTKFGIIEFETIKKNFINKLFDHGGIANFDTFVSIQLKKVLSYEKNILFNFNSETFILHPVKLDYIDKEEFESCLDIRCDVFDNDIHIIVNLIKNNTNNIGIQELLNKSKLLPNREGFYYNENEIINTYSDKSIVLINEITSIVYLLIISKSFNVIGVDLEGILTKKAEIELIQINNGKQTFLIDIHHITKLHKDLNLMKLVKIILTFTFENENIIKIFHYGRQDCLALHSAFKICPVNYIDISAVYLLLNQFIIQKELYENFIMKLNFNEFVNTTIYDNEYNAMLNNMNIPLPGLNKILEEYEPNKKTNHLKGKIHKMFENTDNRTVYFAKRPLEEEWLMYCALDVMFLIDCYKKMILELKNLIQTFFDKRMKDQGLNILLRLISLKNLKYSCECLKE